MMKRREVAPGHGCPAVGTPTTVTSYCAGGRSQGDQQIERHESETGAAQSLANLMRRNGGSSQQATDVATACGLQTMTAMSAGQQSTPLSLAPAQAR